MLSVQGLVGVIGLARIGIEWDWHRMDVQDRCTGQWYCCFLWLILPYKPAETLSFTTIQLTPCSMKAAFQPPNIQWCSWKVENYKVQTNQCLSSVQLHPTKVNSLDEAVTDNIDLSTFMEKIIWCLGSKLPFYHLSFERRTTSIQYIPFPTDMG